MLGPQAFQHSSALAATGVSRIYCAEGDSITAAPQSYVVQFAVNAKPGTTIRNLAVGGSSLASMTARQSAVDALLPTPRLGRFICSVLIGANDLGAFTAQAYSDQLAIYCDARRAAGWQVVVCTVLPSNAWATSIGNAAFETLRSAFNDIIRGWVGTHCSAVADFSMTPVGAPGGQNVPAYYEDGLHPTPLAHSILEPVIRACVNGL